MSGRRGDVLEEDETGHLREAYLQIRQAANAAGFLTAEPSVQIALIGAHAVMALAGTLANAIEGSTTKVTEEWRRARRERFS